MAPEPWHWWLLGGALVLLEAVAPGFVLIWLGLAALAVGGVLWLLPGLAWPFQITLFALATLALVLGWLAGRRRQPSAPEGSALNRRAEALVGELAVLVEPIEGGRGRARIGDTVWPVRGPELAAGERVRIVGAHGARLEVEPAPADP